MPTVTNFSNKSKFTFPELWSIVGTRIERSPPLSLSNDSAARQVEWEQARVSTLYELLTERISEARTRLAELLRTPAESASETYERGIAADRLTQEIGRLEGSENGLAFGRIDWADGTTLHIGRIGLQTEDDDLPLLVDWRANAARPFYEATPVHPMNLRRRRHLRLDGRAVVSVSDELLDGSAPTTEDVVGDGPLTEALSARRTGRMHAAVATLQTESPRRARSRRRMTGRRR
jgi:DNA helicase IV